MLCSPQKPTGGTDQELEIPKYIENFVKMAENYSLQITVIAKSKRRKTKHVQKF